MEKCQDKRSTLTEYIIAGQADFYRLAYSYVKDRDAALDVVQESIVKALTKADSLREPAYVKTWFYRILVNESINWYRRSQRLMPLEDRLDQYAAPETDPGTRPARSAAPPGAYSPPAVHPPPPGAVQRPPPGAARRSEPAPELGK